MIRPPMPSMVDIPSDPKKIRTRLRSYERKLRPERGGFIDDGTGANIQRIENAQIHGLGNG